MFDNIFNEQDMIELQKILFDNKKTITTAESCTGGLIASMITKFLVHQIFLMVHLFTQMR